MTHGAEVPNSVGLFGGWPGSTVCQRFITVKEIEAGASLKQSRDLGPKPGNLPMYPGDVFSVSWQGGGGYGDPLGRSVELVLADVASGLLSVQDAQTFYGVVINGGIVDKIASESVRQDVRAERVGHAVDELIPADAPGLHLGPALRIINGPSGIEVRTLVGAVLCVGHTRWRSGAVARRVDPIEHGITLHRDLVMTAFYCPQSGVQLALDVHRLGDIPFDEIDLQFKTFPESDSFGEGTDKSKTKPSHRVRTQ
jgi:N-methylhydantoinase B